MTRFAKIGVAAILLAATTSSASAIEVWQGHLFITGTNPACENADWKVNDYFNAVYRPAGLSDNGTSTLLALFKPRTAMTYAVSGALSGNGTYTATRIAPAGNAFEWNATYSNAVVGPGSVTDTTKTVVIRVRLTKFANSGNCALMLQGSLGKRPDL
jgi:hypothetical protein